MKTILLVLLAAMIATSAPAQDQDTFGLWAMAGDDYVSEVDVQPFCPVTLYLTLHDPSLAAICGYEVSINNLPDSGQSETDLFGGFNFGEELNYLVGLPGPMVTEDFNVLAAITLVFTSQVELHHHIELGPADPPSIPGHDGPVISDPDGYLVPCGYVTGQPWVFTINPFYISDAQDQTWSAVKHLFR